MNEHLLCDIQAFLNRSRSDPEEVYEKQIAAFCEVSSKIAHKTSSPAWWGLPTVFEIERSLSEEIIDEEDAQWYYEQIGADWEARQP